MPDLGELQLVDYEIPVTGTGIVFVAKLSAFVSALGIRFYPSTATTAADLRAATTMAQMALVDGVTFAFIRQSMHLSVTDAATLLGVTPTDITNWESRAQPVPPSLWFALGDEACARDGRTPASRSPEAVPDLRPRRILIFPDIPMPSTIYPSSSGGCCC